MPLIWTITIYASAVLFLATSFVVGRHRAPWLKLYLFACFPASVVWAAEMWTISRWMRPALLALQALAVIEAICLLHRNCWNPRRRYLFALFCGLCAIGGTFAAAEYPGYPKALWWTQLWLEVGFTASLGASLALFRWYKDFKPVGWSIGNVAILELYCAVEVLALLWPVDKNSWLSVDLTLALIQDCCLLWWIVLYSRDA